MSFTLVTKLLSLAATMTLLTAAVLVAVPKTAGGQLGTQFHVVYSR